MGAAAIALWWYALAGPGRDRPLVLLAGLTVGLNVALWSGAGVLRWLDETLAARLRQWRPRLPPDRLDGNWAEHASIAVLIPAHNEELVIGESIASAKRLMPNQDIYVVSDKSTDATAAIAAAAGVKVLALIRNRGKAGALETAMAHFKLTDRYDAVLILDADSRLDRSYLARAQNFLADADVAAVAGYARAMWDPARRSPIGQLIAAYRDRLYTLQQWLFKFGQGWHRLNVVYIAPGFASVYRTRALRAMDINPRGLVIEDFNMTFQVHRRRLGRIAFSPRIRAISQDPYTIRDYVNQVRRWNLGFWQTVRHHGFWPSLFWVALGLVILESLLVNILILGALALSIGWALQPLTADIVLSVPGYADAYGAVGAYLSPPLLAAAILAPDYVVTCALAAVRRRPRYLLLGLGFIVLKTIDAVLALWAIPQAWRTTSDGKWLSPARRLARDDDEIPAPTSRSGCHRACTAPGWDQLYRRPIAGEFDHACARRPPRNRRIRAMAYLRTQLSG